MKVYLVKEYEGDHVIHAICETLEIAERVRKRLYNDLSGEDDGSLMIEEWVLDT